MTTYTGSPITVALKGDDGSVALMTASSVSVGSVGKTTHAPTQVDIDLIDADGSKTTLVLSGVTIIPGADIVAPGAVTNLTKTHDAASVTLRWSASADRVAVHHYVVKRNDKQVGWPGLARTFTESELAPGTYSYAVYAVDAVDKISEPASIDVIIPANGVLPWTLPEVV